MCGRTARCIGQRKIVTKNLCAGRLIECNLNRLFECLNDIRIVMEPGNGDLTQVAIVDGLGEVALVLAIVRGFSVIDGPVTCIFFGLFGMELGMFVMMDSLMETIERNHIHEVAEQEQYGGRTFQPVICVSDLHGSKSGE